MNGGQALLVLAAFACLGCYGRIEPWWQARVERRRAR